MRPKEEFYEPQEAKRSVSSKTKAL